ncbi:peptidylprolyl isomerase [Abditibacterium utsteinense]|uniref:peptidylprolyl isomerase n=1 Tax=Abditibacterium utsteinense TaxID=1960156 RepID=A0A2S8SS42_9BACT|nr:peptidylprolyl isomerase [Abditibacterium utsteinense]PQV63615.1 peptidylprolyl isomerase [Abditibacterium utsteinense]
MKRFSTLPLLCAFLAGCSAPATQNSNAAPSAEATAPAPAESATATAPVADAKTYRVAPADPRLPSLPPPPLNTKIAAKPRVTLETSRGPITLELDTKAAPLHVRSFLYLSGKGFFNGTQFHRYDDLTRDGKGYIIQGGDPLSKNAATLEAAGTGGPGYEIPREYNDLKHEKLVIAAARSQDPDSAGSQFYITQNPVKFLDEGDGYTVFGKVVKGQNAALKLRKGDVIRNIKIEK